MLNFDKNGYLVPFEEIETDINIAKNTFTFNEHRTNIWQHFEAFILELQNMLQTSFSVWLNGSFTTQKPLPNDLDCVIFIDFEIYEIHKRALFSIKANYEINIDAYLVVKYPQNHQKYKIYQLDKQDWFYLFGNTKRDIYSGLHSPKGFLQLNF